MRTNILYLFAVLLQIACSGPNTNSGEDDFDVYYAGPKGPPPGEPGMGVRIFDHPQKARGLGVDRKILESIISESELVYSQIGSSNKRAKANLFLELVVSGWEGHAVSNWLLVNQEFVQGPEYLNKIDVVLCKTQHCMKLMRDYRARYEMNFKLHYIGFTSDVDVSINQTLDYDLALHSAGKSPHKNTKAVLDTWLKNSKFPQLAVTCHGDCKKNHVDVRVDFSGYKNIDFHSEFLSNYAFNSLVSRRGIYVAPSEIEGFGHYINEGRARGAVVVTSNAPPMNEFIVDGETGFLVPVIKNREFNQFSKENAYELKVHDLENVIKHVMSLSEAEKALIGARAKAAFVHEAALFKIRLKQFLELALQKDAHLKSPFSKHADRFTIVSWSKEPIAISMAESFQEMGFEATIEPASSLEGRLDRIVKESAKNPNVRRHHIIWWAWKVHAGERESASLDKLIAKTKRSKKFVNIMYNFDDPYCWEDGHWNMNAVSKLFDVVFVTSKKRLSDYEKNGAKAYYVPPASHEERHFYDPTPEFKSDVSMAITNFYDPAKFPVLVSRLKIAQELCADKSIDFALYGPEDLKREVPACYKGILDQNISRKLFSSSKINIATSVMDAEGYMSDRIPFVAMSKGLLLMDPIDVSKSVFKDGESCFVIDRNKKITEQVKEILALPVIERDRIRANGQKIAIEKMTYSSWARTIVDAIEAE